MCCQRAPFGWLPIFLLFASAGAGQSRAPAPLDGGDSSAVTFNEVAPIFQARCQGCHHPGDIAPFSLVTYREARPRAKAIREAVMKRAMPPWFADGQFGPYKNDPSLTDAEIQAIQRWVDGGAPEGDPSLLPKPLEFSTGFSLGVPDLTVEMEADFKVSPGGDFHKCFLLPNSLMRESHFLAASEVLPGNRAIVHHAVAYLVNSDAARKKDDTTPGMGWDCITGTEVEGGEAGLTGVYAPGNRPIRFSEEAQFFIPAGNSIVLAVHYHPGELEGADRTRMCLYFSSQPPKRLIHANAVSGQRFTLPAGENSYAVMASYRLPWSIHILSLMPHMHLLGKDQTITAEFPDGQSRVIFRLHDWDMNWQFLYSPEKPIALPAGTVLRTVAHFDNSAANPANPNHPPRPVGWGRDTTGEMMDSYFFFTTDDEKVEPSLLTSTVVSTDGFGASAPDAARSNLYPQGKRTSADAPKPPLPAQFYKTEDSLIDELVAAKDRGDMQATIQDLEKLGILYRLAQEFEESKLCLTQALELENKEEGENSEGTAKALSNLAETFRAQNVNDEAEKYYLKAVATWEKAKGPSAPEMAVNLNNLAMLYFFQDRFAEAEALYKQTMAINEKAYGPSHPNVTAVANNLSFLYRTRGQYAEAEDFALRMVENVESTYGPEHANTATALSTLGNLYFREKKFRTAEENYRKAVAIWQKNGALGTPQAAVTLEELSSVLAQTSRQAAAQKAAALARSIRSQLASTAEK